MHPFIYFHYTIIINMNFINFLKLKKKKRNKCKKKIYNLIVKYLNFSIFSFYNFGEFEKIYFNNNKKYIYVNYIERKINCLITYLPTENEKILKKNLFNYLLKNPFRVMFFILNPINFFKNINPPKDYLQLFHLINLNLKFVKRKTKYDAINKLHKKVIKDQYKGVYAIYKNTNLIAKKYYFNNGYKLFKKNFFYSLATKRFS